MFLISRGVASRSDKVTAAFLGSGVRNKWFNSQKRQPGCKKAPGFIKLGHGSADREAHR